MVGKNTNIDLMPDTGAQMDLFICDVADAVLKDIQQHLEHPFYSLTKKPPKAIKRYEYKGNWNEITPSLKGQATIYDKDILIYCISQLIAALNDKERTEPISKRVEINCADLLRFANRGNSGRSYLALVDAIDRLAGTRISTNIINKHDGTEKYSNFGLINSATIERKFGLDGRMMSCEIELSDWVFNSIKKDGVLTLHPDYFKLGRPIERRVYELARKHCGQKISDEIFVETLFKKSGSNAELKEFRRAIKEIAEANELPDYELTIDEETDKIYFTNRKTMPIENELSWDGSLSAATFEKVALLGMRTDKYVVEQEFRNWVARSRINVKNGNGLFISFCRRRAKLEKKAA